MAVIRGLASHSPPADFKMATAPSAVFQKLLHCLLLQRIAVPWERQGPQDQGLLSGGVQPILPLTSLPNVPQRPQRRRLRNGTEPLNRSLRRLARRTRPSLTLSRLLPGHPRPCPSFPFLSNWPQQPGLQIERGHKFLYYPVITNYCLGPSRLRSIGDPFESTWESQGIQGQGYFHTYGSCSLRSRRSLRSLLLWQL